VPRHRQQLLVAIVPARARANDGGAAEGGDAARHVHDARAREVDAPAEHRIVDVLGEGGKEATRGPNPVHDDRVDPAGDDDGVDQVRDELRPLRHGTRDDCGGRRREAELEEPEREFSTVRLFEFASPPHGEERRVALGFI